MTLAMVLLAMNGAAAQVASTEGVWAKARVAAVLAYLFTKEMVGFAALLPSASRSLLLYSCLPSHPFSHLLLTSTNTPMMTSTSKVQRLRLLCPHLRWFDAFKVLIARDIRYGSAKRNLLDVYVPEAAMVVEGHQQRPWPVVMFVHGGIWASGNKELFAHVGACLANLGVLAVVVQYTLFPEVLAWEQVREVSLALTWVLDNAEHYGGDRHNVTLMGHSAGAHLAALVVWERFKARQLVWHRRAKADDDASAREVQSEIDEEDLDEEDLRQPCNFMGLAGVYDILEHIKYEQKRGVYTMSCMTPAMGGRHLVEAMSPVRLFYSVKGKTGFIGKEGEECSDPGSEGSDVCESDAHCVGNGKDVKGDAEACNGDMAGGAHSCKFPRCMLLCSSSDTVVPVDTSMALHAVLQEELGLPSELVVFHNLGHGDFVMLDGRQPELVSLRSHILKIVRR